MVDYDLVIKEIWKDLKIVKEPDRLELARKLEERTRNFAIRIIRNQLTKSGTSIGANYREANRARSKADFRSKIRICESEASETDYWLEIIKELDFIQSTELDPLLKEGKELLAIFTSISKSLK